MRKPWSWSDEPARLFRFGDGFIDLNLKDIALHDRFAFYFCVFLPCFGLVAAIGKGLWWPVVLVVLVMVLLWIMSRLMLLDRVRMRVVMICFYRVGLQHVEIPDAVIERLCLDDAVRLALLQKECGELAAESRELAERVRVPRSLSFYAMRESVRAFLVSAPVTDWLRRVRAYDAKRVEAERDLMRRAA